MLVLRGPQPPAIVAQPEHARISGEFARRWKLEELDRFGPEVRDQFNRAVAHHDDGWIEWERKPERGDDGLPLAFNEIPRDEHAAIWKRSIDRAAEHHPYGGILVAGHALRLYRDDPTPDDHAADRSFHLGLIDLAEERVDALRSRLRQRPDPWPDVADRTAEHSRLLSAFDSLSLQLLGGIPRGDRLRVERDHRLTWNGEALSINPWPFERESLEITVTTTDNRTLAWRISADGASS